MSRMPEDGDLLGNEGSEELFPDASSSDEAMVPLSEAGKRLDVVLRNLFPDFSRSRLQGWLKAGSLTVDGASPSAATRVMGGEHIRLGTIPSIESVDTQPQPIPLEIVFEDKHLFVINKSANRVMHPAAGNPDNTIQNGLLHLDPELRKIPRAGIVHRLDKDTTGLFVVARTLKAHHSLVDQLQTRTMGREYSAVVQGELVSGGTVNAALGRHPKDRKRMAIRQDGKSAVTHYRVCEKFRVHTLLHVKLESGRTHQIRVHMASVKHPLVGDMTYGGRNRVPPGFDVADREAIAGFPRQALHAHALALIHPDNGERLRWEIDLPDDILSLLDILRERSRGASNDSLPVAETGGSLVNRKSDDVR